MSDVTPRISNDEEPEVSLETVKHRALRGVAVITSRAFILNIIAQIAQLALLAYLTPSELGVFWIVNSLVLLSVTFSDVGLAAALIQKKQKPTEQDLKTTFTTQIVLSLLILIVIHFVSPHIVSAYSLPTAGRVLIYVIGFGIFLAYLKTIPSVLLERRLEFVKFVFPEVIENLVFYLTVVFFAARGYGIESFIYGVLFRGIAGVIVIYLLAPWKPGMYFSLKSFKELIKFGLPYQFNSILANIKDRGMSAILGLLIGNEGVGYIGSAERISQIPLRFFMDSVTKVSFPAFARMQDKKDALASAVTRSIFFLTFLVYPTVIGMAIILPVFINVFPLYQKWSPAIIPLSLFSIGVLFAAVSTQLTVMLSSIGRITTVSKLMIMWSVLTLTLVPILARSGGVNGAALGYTIVHASSVVAIVIARKYVRFSLMESIGYTGIATFGMAAILITLRLLLADTLLNMVFEIIVGGTSYLAIIYLFKGKELTTDVKKFVSSIRKK